MSYCLPPVPNNLLQLWILIVCESSESEAAISDSAQSSDLFQHLGDDEMFEFEIRNDEPGVNCTTNQCCFFFLNFRVDICEEPVSGLQWL